MGAVGRAAVAVFRFGVRGVAGADAGVRAVAVGRPRAPIVPERLAVRKGGLGFRALGAFAAAGAGLVVDGCMVAVGLGFQILCFGNLGGVAVRREAAIRLAADLARRPFLAGRRSAAAGLIDRRQGGVAVGHRAGVGRVRADAGRACADGQLPTGEVLPGGGVLCRVGDGVAADNCGGGALLNVDECQRVALSFCKAGVFVPRQHRLGDVAHGRGACLVRADPDAVIFGERGVYRVGGGLRRLQDDRAAGDPIGAGTVGGVRVNIQRAVLRGGRPDLCACEIEHAAALQIERIAGIQGELAVFERGRAIRNDDAETGAVGDELAAGHFKAARELRAHGRAGEAELTRGELVCAVERDQIALAALKEYLRAAELDRTVGRDAVRSRRRAGAGDVEPAAGERGLARAILEPQTRLAAVEVERAACHLERTACVLGELNADQGVHRDFDVAADLQLSRAVVEVAAGRGIESMTAAAEIDGSCAHVLDRRVDVADVEQTGVKGDRALCIDADRAAFRGVCALQIQSAGSIAAVGQRKLRVFVNIHADIRGGHIDRAALELRRGVRLEMYAV